MRILVSTVAAWVAAAASTLFVSALLYGRNGPGLVFPLAVVWQAAIFAACIPVVYLPALSQARNISSRYGSGALYLVVAFLLGIVPTLFDYYCVGGAFPFRRHWWYASFPFGLAGLTLGACLQSGKQRTDEHHVAPPRSQVSGSPLWDTLDALGGTDTATRVFVSTIAGCLAGLLASLVSFSVITGSLEGTVVGVRLVGRWLSLAFAASVPVLYVPLFALHRQRFHGELHIPVFLAVALLPGIAPTGFLFYMHPPVVLLGWWLTWSCFMCAGLVFGVVFSLWKGRVPATVGTRE